jgi:hypothetical protein
MLKMMNETIAPDFESYIPADRAKDWKQSKHGVW